MELIVAFSPAPAFVIASFPPANGLNLGVLPTLVEAEERKNERETKREGIVDVVDVGVVIIAKHRLDGKKIDLDLVPHTFSFFSLLSPPPPPPSSTDSNSMSALESRGFVGDYGDRAAPRLTSEDSYKREWW